MFSCFDSLRRTDGHPAEHSFQAVLTVAREVGLVTCLQLSILHPSCRRVCGGLLVHSALGLPAHSTENDFFSIDYLIKVLMLPR
jgi:hypothetical protein